MTSELFSGTRHWWLTLPHSANDLFSFEIEAGGSQFQADSDARTALETLVDANQWMIYRNIFTNVLHWDFVGSF